MQASHKAIYRMHPLARTAPSYQRNKLPRSLSNQANEDPITSENTMKAHASLFPSLPYYSGKGSNL
jgi:hypothetical protein